MWEGSESVIVVEIGGEYNLTIQTMKVRLSENHSGKIRIVYAWQATCKDCSQSGSRAR
jgi:hypothetical protein